MKKQKEKSTAGFVLTLIGGLFILGVSVLYGFFMSMFLSFGGGEFLGIFGGMVLAGVVSGILVIAGSILIYSRKNIIGAILAIVFSLVGLAGLGGFFIGTILGVIGGILALVKK